MAIPNRQSLIFTLPEALLLKMENQTGNLEKSMAECGRVRQSAVTAEAPNSMTVTQLQQKFQCIYLYRKQN